MTEYILVLVVVVGIILGALYQFNSAVRVWADNYFGDYLACLIESGELPSLDGGASGECNQIYKPFSIADGRPLVGKGIGAGGGNGAGGGSENNNSSGDSGSEDGYSGGDSGGGSKVVQSVPNANFDNFGGATRFRAKSGRSAAGADDGKDALNTGAAGPTDLSGYESGKSVRIALRNTDGIRGGRISEDEKEKEREPLKVSSESVTSEVKKGSELIRVDRKPATAGPPPDDEDFTFGKFLRYLIIAAIIIAIILFIGGQMLQVSKSME
jgi:hypothetical protein